MLFPVAFTLDLPQGRCVAVALPTDVVLDEAAVGALDFLLPEERALLATLPAARRVSWAGGRAALRRALDDVGASTTPLLPTPRGAPRLPTGFLGSISHKQTIAVALAARGPAPPLLRGLGIDVEHTRPRPVDIGPRVLTVEEQAALRGLSETERQRRTLMTFSAKESIYKAIDPFVQRFVSFQEASVVIEDTGNLTFDLGIADGSRRFAGSGSWRQREDLLVTTAEIGVINQ